MNKVFALALLLAAAMFSSCNDGKQIGDDIQPEKDKLKVDTAYSIPFEVNSFSPDSILTSGLDNFLFGGYYNKDFGLTRGHFVTQFRFNTFSVLDTAKKGSIVIDSIRLVLPYLPFFGDSLSVNELQVYELQKSIDNYTKYYSNFNIKGAIDETKMLGSKYYRAVDSNNELNTGVTGIYGITIPLDREFGQRLYDDLDQYKDDVEVFQQQYMKGLCVLSSFGTKALIQLNHQIISQTNEPYMRLELHYHDIREDSLYLEGDTALLEYPPFSDNFDTIIFSKDSIVNLNRRQYYYVNNECARFSVLEHDFTEASIDPEGTDPNAEYSFLRGAGSLRTRIKFPDFRSLPEFAPLEGEDSARIAINSAKLVMSIDYDAINVNTTVPPDNIAAYIDKGDEISRVPDILYGWDYFGGVLDYGTFTYEINVAEYVQQCLDGTLDGTPDLIIGIIDGDKNPSSEAYLPYFTLLNTRNHKENPMTFEVVFTRY